jgi:hypothetical protein
LVDGIAIDSNIKSIEICHGCQTGKGHRQPFPTSTSITTKPLELVHCDLCGPMRVPTPDGARYFVIFVDDFSRLQFVSLLVTKRRRPPVPQKSSNQGRTPIQHEDSTLPNRQRLGLHQSRRSTILQDVGNPTRDDGPIHAFPKRRFGTIHTNSSRTWTRNARNRQSPHGLQQS